MAKGKRFMRIACSTGDLRAILAILLAGAAVLGGCAAIERQDAEETENLLSAAGFVIRPADTAEKMASLQAMKQHVIIRRGTEGKLRFLYADAQVCRCLYVGTEANDQQFRKLALEQQIAVDREQAAIDESVAAPWAYDWAEY